MADRFNTNFRCPLCDRLHAIRQCTRFIIMNVEDKLRVVAQKSLCYNCLAQSHSRAQCKSLDRCHRCRKDHHSWLHPLPSDRVWVSMTAVVNVKTQREGSAQLVRVLIDPNVPTSRIMASTAEILGCTVRQNKTKIQVANKNNHEQRFMVDCVVEKKIYGCSPSSDVVAPMRECDSDARKKWHKSRPCYLILGADVQHKMFLGAAKGRPGMVYIQDTIFGFVYFGDCERRVSKI